VSVEDEPFATVVGFAVIDTVGSGGGGGAPCTVTVADAIALPPVPAQVREKLVPAVSATVPSLPEVALAPDQPAKAGTLEAVQELAPVDDQVSVEDWPLGTSVGFAESETVGTGGVGGGGGAGGVPPPWLPWVPPPPPPPQCASRKQATRTTNRRAALVHIPARYGFRNMSPFPPPLMRAEAGTPGGWFTVDTVDFERTVRQRPKNTLGQNPAHYGGLTRSTRGQLGDGSRRFLRTRTVEMSCSSAARRHSDALAPVLETNPAILFRKVAWRDRFLSIASAPDPSLRVFMPLECMFLKGNAGRSC
jgi:hypothetical protein